MRAYELMVICDGDLDESTVSGVINTIHAEVETAGGTTVTTDKKGKQRYAYEINKKTDGFYLVLELLAEGGALDRLENSLRLSDEVVRHKLIRLPDEEAAKRGMLGEQAASVDSESADTAPTDAVPADAE